jgi:drug/metabolite transporter (DMT)-like permease
MTRQVSFSPGATREGREATLDRDGRASPLLIAIALGIVYVVWGSTYLAIRIMVEDMPPLVGAGSRYLGAFAILWVMLAVRHGLRWLAVTPRQLVCCSLLGLLLPAGGNGLVTVGEHMGAPSGIAALLIAAVPLWVICYRLMSGDRPAARTVSGVLLGFAGLAFLITSAGITGSVRIGACAIIVFASACWSFGSWIQPRLSLPADPFVTTTYEMLAGGLVLMLSGLLGGERIDVAAYSPRSVIAWAYLVVFGTVLAFSAYVWVLGKAPISLVATYAYVNPVVAVFLGWIVLSEPITLPIIAGGSIVIAAVAIVVSAERHPHPRQVSDQHEFVSDRAE